MLNVLNNNNAVPVECWSCSVGHNHSTLFCPHCSKIQPPPGGDFFTVFGLQPQLNLDLAALETEFHRLSRRLHPDRYARAQSQEKEWSLADTALVNDAYRTLKDPLRRTEYLLKLLGTNGADHAHEQDGKGRNNPSRVPADLLEEAFELNMQLEEMRMARKAGASDPETEAALKEAKTKFTALLTEVDQDLRSAWTAWDAGNESVRTVEQKKMEALLDRRRYLSNLVRDVNEVLGA